MAAVVSFTSVASLAGVPPFLPPSHHDAPTYLQTKVGGQVEDLSPSTSTTTSDLWPA